MRTTLIFSALAVLAIAVLGGIVWLATDDGDRRAAEIGAAAETSENEPLKEGPTGSLRWRGGFDCELAREAPYQALDLVSYKGSTYIATGEVAECVEPPSEPWDLFAQAGENGAPGAQGAQGPAGSFSGTFQSPDGKYKLTVSDAGIRAEGPSGRWYVDNSGLTLDSAAALTVKSAAKLDLSAGAVASLRGSMTHVGCASRPVARLGDNVSVPGTAQGSATTGTIQQGAPTVLTC